MLRRLIGAYGSTATNLLLGEMACRAASFLLFVALARLANLESVGRFALASAIATSAVVLVDMGLNQRVASRTSLSPWRASDYVRETIGRKFQLLPLFLLAAFSALTVLTGEPWGTYGPLLLVVGLAFWLLETSGVLDAGLRGMGVVAPVALARWTRAGVIAVGSILLLAQPTELTAASIFAVGATADALILLLAWRREPAALQLDSAPAVLDTSKLAPFACLTAGVGVYARLDQMILGALVSPATLAVYAGAYKFYEVLVLVPQVFARARISLFLRGDWSVGIAAARRSALLCGVLVAALPLYMWLPGVTLGAGYGEGNLVLAILVISLPGTGASAVLLTRLLAEHQTRWVPAIVAWLQVGLNGLLVFLLVPRLGLLGAAAAVALLETTNPLFYIGIRRVMNARVR